MKKLTLCLAFFSFVVPLSASSWEKAAHRAARAGCYLEAADIVVRRLEVSRDRVAQKRIQRFDQEMSLGRRELWLSYPDLCYRSGYQAWRRGDLPTARNWWFKFVESARRGAFSPIESRVEEVQEFLAKSDAELTPVVVDPPLQNAQPLRPVEKTSFSRGRTPAMRKPSESRNAPRVTSQELSEQAGFMRRNGQLKDALRLYKLAQTLEPSSAEVRTQIADIEREME